MSRPLLANSFQKFSGPKNQLQTLPKEIKPWGRTNLEALLDLFFSSQIGSKIPFKGMKINYLCLLREQNEARKNYLSAKVSHSTPLCLGQKVAFMQQKEGKKIHWSEHKKLSREWGRQSDEYMTEKEFLCHSYKRKSPYSERSCNFVQ